MSDGESLYRQIDPSAGDPIYVDPSRTPTIHFSIFLPSRDDTDGLSLINAKRRSPEWSAFRPDKPHALFSLLTLPRRLLCSLAIKSGFEQFEIREIPDQLDLQFGEPYAHCVAEQVNRISYDKDRHAKKLIKQWAISLAGAFEENEYFLLGPFRSRRDDKFYRPN